MPQIEPRVKRILFLPIHILLLPIFFVLHTYQENSTIILGKHAVSSALWYCLLSIIIFGVTLLFFRDTRKAALATIIWMAFFFFFRTVLEFLKAYVPIKLFSRYIFLLPMAVLLMVCVFIFLKKSDKRFRHFNFILNLLLIIYIVLDTTIVIWKSVTQQQPVLTVNEKELAKHIKKCDSCAKPDVYFLVFDEYTSSAGLKAKYNYNNDLDSFLISRGFSVQTSSRSNYNSTAFSTASILNMSYIQGFENTNAITIKEYAASHDLIKNNQMMKVFMDNGYEIVNYSFFNVLDKEAITEQYFLPLQKKFITARTFFYQAHKDIGWVLYEKFSINPNKEYLKQDKNNNLVIDLIKKAAAEKSKTPRFIYGHFLMPHAPFFFDKYQKKRDESVSLNHFDFTNPASYINYLPYVNTRIRDLVNTILQNDPSSVIIIISDHGFRPWPAEPDLKPDFMILNAVYYPDRNYEHLYDSISGVNQFRVVFNKLFHQSLPLLKDTSIFLTDKE